MLLLEYFNFKLVVLYCFNSEGLSTNAKLFADDSPLFFFIIYFRTSANNLNKDFERMSKWANQQKIKFNPDTVKQAQEVSFSCKTEKRCHPPLLFNNINVTELRRLPKNTRKLYLTLS